MEEKQSRKFYERVLYVNIFKLRHLTKPPARPASPDFHINFNYSFKNERVDFANPFYCKEKNDISNYYLWLFSCSVTRAVHLHLTVDLGHGCLILAVGKLIFRKLDDLKTIKTIYVTIALNGRLF